MTRRNSFSNSFRSPKRGIQTKKRQSGGTGLADLQSAANGAKEASASLPSMPSMPGMPSIPGMPSASGMSPDESPALLAMYESLKYLPPGPTGWTMKIAIKKSIKIEKRRILIQRLKDGINDYPMDDADHSKDDTNIFRMEENNEGNEDRNSFSKLVRVYKKDLDEKGESSKDSLVEETFRIMELSGNQFMYTPLMRYLNHSLNPKSEPEDLRKILNSTYSKKCTSLGVLPYMNFTYWLNYPTYLIGPKINIHDAALEADYDMKIPLRCLNENINKDPQYKEGQRCKNKQQANPEEKKGGRRIVYK
jgi:hypothetical protein